jgi:hypothetical protein
MLLTTPGAAIPHWPGETIVVLAGGPSLSTQQIGHVVRARLIGNCKILAVKQTIFLTGGSQTGITGIV